MATQPYNQAFPRNRTGGRGRGNDQPRYRPPQQVVSLTQRSQVPPMATGTAGQRVIFPQHPQAFYFQQVPTTSANASFIRAASPYPQIPQFTAGPGLLPAYAPQQLFSQQQQLANAQFSQTPPINLQLSTGLSQPAAPPTTHGVGTTQFPVPPKATQPPAKRASKAIKIVDPDTMAEVDIKQPSTNSENVSTTTAVSSEGAPPPNEGPTHSNIKEDFKLKVQSTMNVSSPVFVPSQPITQDPPRPNAIIRRPDKASQDMPTSKQVDDTPPVVNGVEPTKEVSSKEESSPPTKLEEKPEESVSSEAPPTKETPPVLPPTEQPSPVLPPTEEPSSVQPPIEEPPRDLPPSEESPPVLPPTEEPPRDLPPSEEPPPVQPPTEEPPRDLPPTEEPPPKPLPEAAPQEVPPSAVPPPVLPPTEEPTKSVPPVEEPLPETVVQSAGPTETPQKPLSQADPEPTPPVDDSQTTPTETTPSEATPTESSPPPEPVEPSPPVAEPVDEGESEGEGEVAPLLEPPVDDGKPKKYDRNFLLSFAENKACQDPPAGLVRNMDVFQKDGGHMLYRGPPLAPGYDSSRGGKKGGNMRRGLEAKKVIAHQPLQVEKVELHKAEERWVRSKTVMAKLTDDEKLTTELYRKFQGILNKLTPQKFQRLAEQALTLDINTEERLKGCIDKIFTKALEEPSFSIAYANLCKVLSPLKVEREEEEEGKTKQTNFRRELLTKCQAEFERDKKDDEQLEEMNKAIEAATTPEQKKQLEEERGEFTTKARKRSLGNIRFIGELFKLQMLSETIMHECIVRLLKSTSDEESLECFARLITTTGKELDQPKAKPRIDGYFTRIADIIKKGKIPARIKFMLQDVQELRRNDWVPRQNQASTLKTIDQIHAEAKLKEEEDKRMAAQHHALTYTKGRGGGDDRRRGSGMKEEWTSKGKEERAPREKLDRSRLAALKKDKKVAPPTLGPQLGPQRPGVPRYTPTQPTSAPQEKDKKPSRSSSSGSKRGDKVPSGRGSGSGPRRGSQTTEQVAALEAVVRITNPGSNPGSKPSRSQSVSNKPAPPPAPDTLDEATVRRKTGTIVDELAENGDLKEAVDCVLEMQSPGLVHILVAESITHTLEKKQSARQAAGKLMEKLIRDNLLSEAKFVTGLNEVLEFADDLEMDVPKLWVYLAEILSPLFSCSTLPLSCLCEVPPPLVESSKAALLVAEVLAQCCQSQSKDNVLSLWTAAKMDWTTLGVNSEDLPEFLTKQSLEFLLPPSSATPQAPPYYQEMATFIANSDNTNDDVFDWVQRSVSDVKSCEFINALATAIAESTVTGSGTNAIYNQDMFEKRAVVLKKYVDEDNSLQVQVLYALQVVVTRLEHPPKLLNQMFNELYNIDVIVEHAFKQWKDHGTVAYGKGNCVQNTNSFFEWLDSASVESEEDGAT